MSIDVPNLNDGVRFYEEAFGFEETARPADGYAALERGGVELGLLEKAPGTEPAKGSGDLRRYERRWTPVHVDFYVENFEEALEHVLAAGAQCEQRFSGGDHPPVAFCSDPFGNGFCVVGPRFR